MTTEAPDGPSHPASSNSSKEFKDRVKRIVDAREAARAERRARFAAVMPEPRMSIVAWVDLLGFREQIVQADTSEKLQAAYRRMRDVQEEFDKETASVDPDEAEMNRNTGKQVLALSDGLVIALDLESDEPYAQVASFYERVGMFLEGLRLAQTRCASVGNLVRGGVALGYFWFEEDILLSPALVSAYEMETKHAINPVIILEREFAESLRSMKESEGFSSDWDPMADLFRDCEWMDDAARSKYVMLDFMPIFLEDHDPRPFLRNYSRRLLDARSAAPEKARRKIDWLIQYARQFVAAELPELEVAFEAPPQ